MTSLYLTRNGRYYQGCTFAGTPLPMLSRDSLAARYPRRFWLDINQTNSKNSTVTDDDVDNDEYEAYAQACINGIVTNSNNSGHQQHHDQKTARRARAPSTPSRFAMDRMALPEGTTPTNSVSLFVGCTFRDIAITYACGLAHRSAVEFRDSRFENSFLNISGEFAVGFLLVISNVTVYNSVPMIFGGENRGALSRQTPTPTFLITKTSLHLSILNLR